jgi:hypothetical protein
MKVITPITICIDADGTVFTHDFPKIGKDIGAAPVLKKLVANGHRLILWTMRSDKKIINGGNNPNIHYNPNNYLQQAVNWFKNNGIELHGVNHNVGQAEWTESPKCFCDLYIDDSALGIPLIKGLVDHENGIDVPVHDRPFVDWEEVEKMLIQRNIL